MLMDQRLQELETRSQAAYDNQFNHTLHAHIDIAGGLVEGTLLSRILYWFAPNQNGKTKLRVVKDGHYWLAKNRTDWADEIRISPKQYDRAIKILINLELVTVKLYKFNGLPTTHIRVNFDKVNLKIREWKHEMKYKMLQQYMAPEEQPLESLWNKDDLEFAQEVNPVLTTNFRIYPKVKSGITERENSELPKGEIRSLPKGNLEVDLSVKSLTENTTGITTRNTTRITHTNTIPGKNENIPEDKLSECVYELRLSRLKKLWNETFGTSLQAHEEQRLLNGANIDEIIETVTKIKENPPTKTDIVSPFGFVKACVQNGGYRIPTYNRSHEGYDSQTGLYVKKLPECIRQQMEDEKNGVVYPEPTVEEEERLKKMMEEFNAKMALPVPEDNRLV